MKFFFRNAYLVKLATNVKTSDYYLISNIGDTVLMPPVWSSFLLIYEEGDSMVHYYIDSLNKIYPKVKYAHPNYIGQSFTYSCSGNCGTIQPNDTYYCSHQHALHDDVNSPFLLDGDINIEPAWNLESGEAFVKVGIFDSGLEWDHEDFTKRPNLGIQGSKVLGGFKYTNPTSNLFALGANSSTPTNPLPDDWGHGTKIAGIIGALRNNDIGIAGIAGGEWCDDPSENQSGVSLVSLGVSELTPGPAVTSTYMDKAITAWNDILYGNLSRTVPKVDITNHSYGWANATKEYKEKVYLAYRLGMITVASRGQANSGNTTNSITYPSCFNDDWVLNVGGSDQFGEKSFGFTGGGLDIIAPYGKSTNSPVFSSTIYNNYAGDLGTSFSAPMVSGVAGLLLSYLNNSTGNADPNNLSPEDVEEILQRTTWSSGLNPPYNDIIGWGRLDAGAALEMVNKNTSRLIHISSLDTYTDETITKISGLSDIDLELNEDIPIPNLVITKGLYKAEVYKAEQVVEHNITLLSGETIQGFWARSSSSDGYPLYTVIGSQNFLEPYEKVYVDQNTLPDENEAEIWSYYYYLKDFNTGAAIGWVPRDPHNARMDYTLYLSGGTISSNTKLDDNQKFSVYPNPSSNSFTIQFEASNSTDLTVEITNVSGQRIRSIQQSVLQGLNSILVDATELSSGIYYIKIMNAQLAKTVKLCIQK